jgi:SAM-dependent methyltransferase
VLDVGAAAGFILRGLIDSGWAGEGVEPNAAMAEYARTRQQLKVSTCSFEDFESDSAYDLVTMIQVVAHFQRPAQALSKAASLLRPGGLLLIETWNPESWLAKLFGRHWHEYSPPSVLHCFPPETLARTAGAYGLSRTGSGRPSKWLNGRHVKSLLKYALPQNAAGRALAVLPSAVIPDSTRLPYPSFDLYWMLFRRE